LNGESSITELDLVCNEGLKYGATEIKADEDAQALQAKKMMLADNFGPAGAKRIVLRL